VATEASQIASTLFVVFGIHVVLVAGSVLSAERAARRRRAGGLAWAAGLSVAGLAVMALGAWTERSDEHYDDFGSAVTEWLVMLGGALLLFGLAPVIPWLLGLFRSRRLPPAVRLAGHDRAGDRPRTARWIAITMVAAALASAATIVAFATAAQDRAQYVPEVRPGSLVVEMPDPRRMAAARAAVQRVLPGAPVIERVHPTDRYRSFGVSVPDAYRSYDDDQAAYIGDQALLRYLTGDPATPYDEGRVVVVSADSGIKVGAAEIWYDTPAQAAQLAINSSSADLSDVEPVYPARKPVPAIVARPADLRMDVVFIPAEIVRDLGFRVEPGQLLVDPSAHRTTPAEQDRLDALLGGTAQTYVERGYQRPATWIWVVAPLMAVAVAAAIAASRVGSASSRRIATRLGAPLRGLAACRAGLRAALGSLLGGVAGSVIGVLVAWTTTAPIDWDPPPRAPFDTPWPLIIAFALGPPVIATVAGRQLR
jgi:hypothetical protein